MVEFAPYVVVLDGSAPDDRHFLGGKAASLNALVRAGLPVPPAFCVTVEACRTMMTSVGVERFDACGNGAAARNLLHTVPMPEALRRDITAAYEALGCGAVAVRSSAVAEDGAHASFAGQFATFLNVEGLEAILESVRSCWASLWADHAELYGTQRQTALSRRPAERAIAVVVQRMVVADAAGVLFTRDPVGADTGCMLIEAAWGVGEGIVSSQVITDSYLVDGRELTITGRTIRHKPLRTECLPSGGTVISATPPEMADQSTLTDEQAVSLAGYAQAMRKGGGAIFLDCELDIEWALLGGNIVILQARPITVADARAAHTVFADPEEEDPSMRDNVLYSRMDTGEIVTGLMTPLGLSFCRFYQRAIHGPAVKTIGLRKMMPARHFMGYIRGYVYLNISASAYLLTQCPPTRDAMKFTRRYADDQRILDDYRNPYGETMRGTDHFMGGLYWIGRQMVNLATSERTARRMETLRRERTDRFLALDLEAMTLPQLDAELTLIDRHFRESCAAYMPFFLQSFALYDALAELCEKWLGAHGNGLQNRIKASLNNLRTIEVTAGVVALAEEVRSNAGLSAIFLETPPVELADRLRIHPVGRIFWEGPFHQFLRQFGARGRQEFELTIPRWNDDPSYLLNVIRLYLRNDVDLEEKMSQSDALREAETRRLFAVLPLRARFQLRLVIAGYGRMARLRERIRPTFIAETWFYRRIVMEVMRRVCAAGAVRPADIPFIDFDELRGYVAGRKTAGQAFARDLIEKNRREHLVNLRGDEPPMSIVGGWIPARTRSLKGVGGDADILTGVGASPGVVVARARVITDLQSEAGEFQKGEILVARYTDASWTPLFLLASGIVADIGSTLSHSSIVSREFGIPAVVNTRAATQSIRTGDCLYIDGDAGLVRIEERAPRQDAA